MLITVNRTISDEDATVSEIYIDDQFECFGLEDEYREDKVSGETRIPAGRYSVGLRTEGGFHGRYSRSRHFSSFHQGMLQVIDVPGFEYILIHCGNTDDDTAGCLLVGQKAITEPGDLMITHSRLAYKAFYKKVIDAAKAGELEILYRDLDRPQFNAGA